VVPLVAEVQVAKLAGQAVHTPESKTNPDAQLVTEGARLHTKAFVAQAEQVAAPVK